MARAAVDMPVEEEAPVDMPGAAAVVVADTPEEREPVVAGIAAATAATDTPDPGLQILHWGAGSATASNSSGIPERFQSFASRTLGKTSAFWNLLGPIDFVSA